MLKFPGHLYILGLIELNNAHKSNTEPFYPWNIFGLIYTIIVSSKKYLKLGLEPIKIERGWLVW